VVSTEYCLIQIPNCPVPRCPCQYLICIYNFLSYTCILIRYIHFKSYSTIHISLHKEGHILRVKKLNHTCFITPRTRYKIYLNWNSNMFSDFYSTFWIQKSTPFHIFFSHRKSSYFSEFPEIINLRRPRYKGHDQQTIQIVFSWLKNDRR
jgi:hypothetical protein